MTHLFRDLRYAIRVLFRTLWVVLVTHDGVYGEGGINDDFGATPPQGATSPQEKGGPPDAS